MYLCFNNLDLYEFKGLLLYDSKVNSEEDHLFFVCYRNGVFHSISLSYRYKETDPQSRKLFSFDTKSTLGTKLLKNANLYNNFTKEHKRKTREPLR